MGKLFKRGRIWFARVPKRGGGTRRISTLCTDKRAAEAALAQLEREAVDPAYAASNKATTQRILDEYLLSRVRLGRSEGTKHHVRVKAGALIGLMPAMGRDITYPVAVRYVDKRLTEGARRTTIKKELRVLKASLVLARKMGLWAGEPEAVIPELEDDYQPKTRTLTPWELVALCVALGADSPRAAHVVLIVATGARWSESLAVTLDEIVEALRTGLLPLHGTKTELSARVVPIVGAARILLDWAADRLHPEVIHWGNVRRDLAAACKRAGIAPVTPNDLRRTFGTWLRNDGIAPNLIGAAMGHTDSRMVERVYGRLTPEALGKLLAAGSLMGQRTDVSEHSSASPATVDASNQAENGPFDGAQGRNRTADTGIFSPLLPIEIGSLKQGESCASEPNDACTWDANGSSRRRLGKTEQDASGEADPGRDSPTTRASELLAKVTGTPEYREAVRIWNREASEPNPLYGPVSRPAPWVHEAVANLYELLGRGAT